MTDPKTDDKTVYAYPPPYPMQGYQEDKINLLDLWRVIWKGKWFTILFVCICTLISIYVSVFKLEKTYKSTTTIIPTTQQKSSLGNLRSLIGSLPISLPSQKTSNIMLFLKSRTLQKRLITKYNMLPILYKNLWDAEQKKWLVEEPGHEPTLIQTLQSGKIQTFYSVSQDKKTGLITIESVGKDPEFCAKMVNNVIRELNSFLENEYDSNAKREREFIEKQLEKATTELERWERQVPNDSLTLSKITREQLVAQTVYTEMRKQLELVKITEAKELETFTILDKAFIPEYHFKPKKRLIVMLSFVCSGFVALFLVFFHNFVQNVRKKELAE